MKKEEILKMVKENGYALKHIKEQTKEICLEAVKQNIDAIRYVKNKILKELNIISY